MRFFRLADDLFEPGILAEILIEGIVDQSVIRVKRAFRYRLCHRLDRLAFPLDTAFEDMSHPQFSGDFLRCFRGVPVYNDRSAGDDLQVVDLRQLADDGLDHPIAEVLLVFQGLRSANGSMAIELVQGPEWYGLFSEEEPAVIPDGIVEGSAPASFPGSAFQTTRLRAARTINAAAGKMSLRNLKVTVISRDVKGFRTEVRTRVLEKEHPGSQ